MPGFLSGLAEPLEGRVFPGGAFLFGQECVEASDETIRPFFHCRVMTALTAEYFAVTVHLIQFALCFLLIPA